jgi:hypothetical protein
VKSKRRGAFALVAVLALPLVAATGAGASASSFCVDAKAFITTPLPSLAFAAGTPLTVRLSRTVKNIDLIDRSMATLAAAAPTASAHATLLRVGTFGRRYVSAIQRVGRALAVVVAKPHDAPSQTRLTTALRELAAAARPYGSALKAAFSAMQAACPHL